MPILIEIDEDVKWLYPKANWQTISINSNDIIIDVYPYNDSVMIFYN